jgi:hypothetical protein
VKTYNTVNTQHTHHKTRGTGCETHLEGCGLSLCADVSSHSSSCAPRGWRCTGVQNALRHQSKSRCATSVAITNQSHPNGRRRQQPQKQLHAEGLAMRRRATRTTTSFEFITHRYLTVFCILTHTRRNCLQEMHQKSVNTGISHQSRRGVKHPLE